MQLTALRAAADAGRLPDRNNMCRVLTILCVVVALGCAATQQYTSSKGRARILNWGTGWAPVDDDGTAFHAELHRELVQGHPLHDAHPLVLGRCLTCDDIVAALGHMPGDSELAVIHLTWSQSSENLAPDGAAWPYFERLTFDEFVARFLEGGEHL